MVKLTPNLAKILYSTRGNAPFSVYPGCLHVSAKYWTKEKFLN